MALNSPPRPSRGLHRKRLTVLVDGRAVQVPEPPRGLSASRQDQREAAALLRDGKQFGPGGPHDPLPHLVRELQIDPVRLMTCACARNPANERRLLTEWQRLLEEVQQGRLSSGEGWSRMAHVTCATPEIYRQAPVDLLEKFIDEATERGVMYAQAQPWRRVELDAAALRG